MVTLISGHDCTSFGNSARWTKEERHGQIYSAADNGSFNRRYLCAFGRWICFDLQYFRFYELCVWVHHDDGFIRLTFRHQLLRFAGVGGIAVRSGVCSGNIVDCRPGCLQTDAQ